MNKPKGHPCAASERQLTNTASFHSVIHIATMKNCMQTHSLLHYWLRFFKNLFWPVMSSYINVDYVKGFDIEYSVDTSF